MQEIIRKETPFGPTFTIVTETGSFEIYYGGNLDLYWEYYYRGSIQTTTSEKIIITRENYFLFALFNELYNDIKNTNLFVLDSSDFLYSSYITNADLKKEKERIRKLNQREKDKSFYNAKRLFKNGAIEWHSVESTYEDGSILTIKPCEEGYEVSFEKSKETEDSFLTYAVRIRNSGSRYEYYNIPFMRMYQELIQGYLNNPQISIDEYMNQKRLEKKPN